MAPSFLDSPFFHVYVYELWALAESVAKKCETVFEACPVPEEDGYIKVDHAVHSLIASLLTEAANVKKLLTVPERLGFRESKDEFAFRVQRTTLLFEALESPAMTELSQVAARNSVEHFDEYLDRTGLKLRESDSSPRRALYNIILSSWDYFDRSAIPLKLYVADERRYFNLDFSADLNALRLECADLIARIRKLGAFKDQDEPGGFILRATWDA